MQRSTRLMIRMVHIKKVEVYGFKSFGYKNTIVNMDQGVMCVTGPNGSGKSNILDAIIFALGENSPKSLRVDRLQSLFHDQSEGRVHRLVRTSVSFDNSDRGIPIDANTVTITREMPPQGESDYYLNGKKVTKTTITDLLDIVRAAPNKLNVVQQGMIMRIAELNSEERRRIIEDIVGLSYFDEKKAEAMKQLDEADRKLEVAMAKMGEIRKHIDDLEEQRNDQLRFQYLEKDIKRFKAIKISNSIRDARERLQSLNEQLQKALGESETVGKELEEVKARLAEVEAEKGKFLGEVDVYSKAKAEVDTGISNIIVRLEQLKASIASSKQRIQQIGQDIPALIKEKESLKSTMNEVRSRIDAANSELRMKEAERDKVAEQVDQLNAELRSLFDRQAALNEQRHRLEVRLKELEDKQKDVSVELSKYRERASFISEKIDNNTGREENISTEQEKLKQLLAQLQRLKNEETSKLQQLDATLSSLGRNRARLEQQIESTSLILEKAGSAAVQYETKIKMAKNLHQEDYAIATLLKFSKEFGILGTFMQLVQWDKQYERAVIATASMWMKALVVKNVKKMLKMIDHAKEMNFPRLRMIPLDLIMAQNPIDIPAYHGVKGRLSDFVMSDQAPNLVDFIFGDIILVDNTETAYALAKQGWKVVTLSGELFEPQASAITLDLNSKITDLTKMILLGESIDSLRTSVDLLRQLIVRKKEELANINRKSREIDAKRREVYRSLVSIDSQFETLQQSVNRHARNIEDIDNRITTLKQLRENVARTIEELEASQTDLNSQIADLNRKLDEIDEQGIDKSINEYGLKKMEIGKTLEQMENQIREQITVISSHKAEINSLQSRIEGIDGEIRDLKDEAREKATLLANNHKLMKEVENELTTFRDKEQQLIDTSGNSVGILQEYDSKIKVISDEEKRLTKHLGNLEKETALSRKEISDLTNLEIKLSQELSEIGFTEPLEGYDVNLDVAELIKEYESLRGSINQLADANYVQVIEGYRGMSSRKNQLESEHNSIVRFIEDIEKEKESVFMEAFDKVNKDVRHMFSTMTDGAGSAWLEIENPDDIFNSGLTFMIQFPNKPARESTSLSGGEKTIAATTFLLALQSLKPSPFYLFDEVDAHLDAQNTERLAKIIVEKSRMSQMIIVTLKDAIVANAQIVHGVYPRNGVSQVVKYKSQDVPITQ